MRITGAWTALVTPFGDDMKINWYGLKRNVDFQISQGINGLVPTGTTGESPTLNWEEHNKVVDEVIAVSAKRIPIIAGTGSNSTQEAVKSTKHAVESGVEAVLLVDCYYNGPSSQELRDEYYGVVAKEFPGTIVVPYIIPGRSGTALSVEDLAILSNAYQNISAVKEATGDLDRMARTRKMLGDNFSIISGDDDLTFKMMSDENIRANGVISVASNVIPGPVSRMIKLFSEGKVAEAREIQEAIAPLLGIVTVKVDNVRVMADGEKIAVNDRYRNPVAIKTLMSGLGMPSGACRKPLGKMSKAGVDVVRNAAWKVWNSNPEVLKPVEDFYDVDIKSRLSDDYIWDALSRS